MKEHIRESNLIEGIDDPQEDKQSLIAWDWLKSQDKIDNHVICHLHKLIMLHQLAGGFKGYYRNVTATNVHVGDTTVPDYSMVEGLMGNWLLDFDINDPIRNHIRFEKIHPFVDGNGRTGRMLMWWHQMHIGQEPMMIKNIDKRNYYKLFKD